MQGPVERITRANAKRYLAVGKVVVPVLAPFAIKAASEARAAWDARRARRLGVAPSELNTYSGKGGTLHARISRVAAAVHELAGREAGRADVERFVSQTQPRLAELAAAVRAAEMMPGERRRTAHRAVAAELDRVEPELLDLLGVGATVPKRDRRQRLP